MSKNTMFKLDSTYQESQASNAVSPVLRDSHAALKKAIAGRDDAAISVAIDNIEHSVVDYGNAHQQWTEAGKLMLSLKQWESAKRLAAKALLSYPKYGAAMRVFGDALTGLNRREEAAECYRFKFPPSVEIEHFGHHHYTATTSKVADDAGLQHHPAFESQRYTLEQPFQMETVMVPDLDHTSMESAVAFVGSVPDGRLWYDGGNAVVWDRKGRLVEDISIGFHRVVNASVQSRLPVKLEGRVCLLGNRSFLNYYHWMCDTLPRLEVLKQAGIDLDSIDHFVVPPLKYDFHWESLLRFGISEDRLHTTKSGEYIQANELFIPIFGSNSLGLLQGDWNPSFLKRTFGPDSPPVERKRRLFISRGTSGPRGISNEVELMAALKPLGFEIIRCEDYKIVEQAEIFAAAEAVVGPHGAGLTNIVFCSPGTVVVELFNAHMASCFWVISELTRLRHAIQFCGRPDDDAGVPGRVSSRNASAHKIRKNAFDVDIGSMIDTLDKLGLN